MRRRLVFLLAVMLDPLRHLPLSARFINLTALIFFFPFLVRVSLRTTCSPRGLTLYISYAASPQLIWGGVPVLAGGTKPGMPLEALTP